MSEPGERSRKLRFLALNEGLCKQYKSLGYAEGKWRAEHEQAIMHQWVNERHEFVMNELAALLPERQKPKRPTDEPAIVSHRTGRPGSNGQQYGERYA